MTTSSASTSPSDPEQPCLADLLDAQVRANPDEIAIVDDSQRITRHVLAQRSRALAAHLRDLGVGPDECVGLFVEPSADLVVGVWGILYASAAYLPLTPDYPDERLRYMIADARVRVVVAQDDLRDRLAELVPAGTTIVPLGVAAPSTPSPADVPRKRLRPEHLAYVIYTSGSTGKPKGVMIEHRSIVNQMRWLRDTYRIDDAVILQKTPMSFDAAQWEILAPACGATVVAGTPGLHRDPERIMDTIRRHDVTVLQCVPTLLRALVDTEDFDRCTSLKRVFTGGEALSRTLAASCLATLPQAELVNLYGPTECTINSSAFTVDRAGLDDAQQSVPIGHPVEGTDYLILDDKQVPVGVGDVGELYIGGVQVARGYLHQPELTAERFVVDPATGARLFRTGDLAAWNADGTAQFAGRADNQVKLRGFRIELDEIRLTVEAHQWVRHAAVIVKDDPRTGFQHLLACVELNPREAALMDQGRHGAHHQSKESRLQVRAQLSNAGVRDGDELTGRPVVDLPGQEPTQRQRRRVFARKTYRFYEGPPVTESALLALLDRKPDAGDPRPLEAVDFATFGEILRYFGQFTSEERLLPKVGYASPGALNATQLHLEIHGLWGLASGYYYYHPVAHRLVLIAAAPPEPGPRVRLHFVGRRRAIEPVYQNNIREVLEIETGHMIGLFEEILPEYGLAVKDVAHTPDVMDHLDCPDEDFYLGTFELVPWERPRPDEVDVYVQVHPDKGVDLPAGQYAYRDGRLERIGGDLVLRKHVIAINQRVYDRASIGITLISNSDRAWLHYVDLGRKLQHLSMSDLNFGFMSSGYSSKSGHDLPAAHRVTAILSACGRRTGACYFFLGGHVSDEQVASQGMKEDAVHMKGPAELIRDDLMSSLPDYMVPNKVVILDRIPFTPNGKIDLTALAASEATTIASTGEPVVPPRTDAERRVAGLWQEVTKQETVSVRDDFFACGGNSLMAVALINRINREFRTSLPMQVIFECPTVEKLAGRVGNQDDVDASRLVRLATAKTGTPVYCWPGLGGYPMNLRLLASRLGVTFYGVQAYGVNDGEQPYQTISQMAAEDVAAIRRQQPHGPYTLWGYSFGTRVATEVAYQLEQAGERVDQLVLVAPGSPRVRLAGSEPGRRDASFENKTYVAVLFSVFAGTVTGPLLDECLAVAVDEESFARFVERHFEGLDGQLIRRIMRVVSCTYDLRHSTAEIAERRIQAPVTVLPTRGDEDSFLDTDAARAALCPVVVRLDADHYSVLREPGVDELVTAVRSRARGRRRSVRSQVNIRHQSVALTDEQHTRLVTAVTRAMTEAFGCDEAAVSIAFEAVAEEFWHETGPVSGLTGRAAPMTGWPARPQLIEEQS